MAKGRNVKVPTKWADKDLAGPPLTYPAYPILTPGDRMRQQTGLGKSSQQRERVAAKPLKLTSRPSNQVRISIYSIIKTRNRIGRWPATLVRDSVQCAKSSSVASFGGATTVK